MGCASSMPTASEPESKDFHDNYILGKKLGRGAFAQVRVATPVNKSKDANVKDLAVKILDLRDENEPEKVNHKLQKEAHMEASIWVAARNHESIVHLHDVFCDETLCYFVMEKCSSGLFQHLERMPEINERSVGNILAQMFHGISHLHSVDVVHRDIKADNFLVGGNDGQTVKISDFGLSAVLPKGGPRKLRGVFGTAPFMCPEMLKGKFYDERADVWSMAVLAYTLFFGDFPYKPTAKTSKAMKQAVAEGRPPKFQPVAPCVGQLRSESAVSFVQTLLERNPEERASADEALQLPYMIAVTQKQHMIECELPSLRPMLYSAKKAGAFEARDLTRDLDIDPLLVRLQTQKHGTSALDNLQNPGPGSPTSPKKIFAPVNSGHSNVWSNTSSFATTASGSTWKNTSSALTTISGASSSNGSSPPSP